MRRHGWTCPECGTHNEPGYRCEGDDCRQLQKVEDREWDLKCLAGKRRDPRDAFLCRSASDTLYRVRRYVGGSLTFDMLVKGGVTLRLLWEEVPQSVLEQAREHFFGVLTEV